jgi:hypothetical protein
MSRTYNVECYSVAGHKVTFKMHNGGNVNKDDIAKAAETRLANLGIPKSQCKVYNVR